MKIAGLWDNLPNTDFGDFCKESAAVGTANGPACPNGKALYGGICYNDNWTKNGYNAEKTAVCTVKYDGDSALHTRAVLEYMI